MMFYLTHITITPSGVLLLMISLLCWFITKKESRNKTLQREARNKERSKFRT